jgi:hypothetical protein
LKAHWQREREEMWQMDGKEDRKEVEKKATEDEE